MGKTIIITGASKGLGLATATYLVNNSHNVVLVARSRDLLENFQSQHSKQVRFVAGDLAQTGLAKKAFDLAQNEFGAIDGLVVNHGILAEMKAVAETSVEEWKKAYDINVFSSVEFVQAAIPHLRKSKGAIVITSSGASRKGTVAWGMYGSSKAVLDHLTSTVAAEEQDITSVAIAPGVVDTGMQKELREVHIKNFTEADAKRFTGLWESGSLLRPSLPGNLMARLVLNAPKDLSGKYFRWDAAELSSFRGDDD